ncbi:MAG: prepilin-type N-terminal cleavage/methylation domain-containing protein [Acidimicrobiales bacterium]
MLQVNRALRQRRGELPGDEGFTLIELLVVLLIIGILLAIAIPTFLSVTKTANNTAVQANLSTALTGSDAVYTESGQTFSEILTFGQGVSTLTQVDTGLEVVNSLPSTAANVISVHVAGTATPVGSVLVLEAFSPGTMDCWGIIDVKTAQTSGDALTEFGAGSPGTYFFLTQKGTATASSCNSGAFTPLNAITESGFPKS